MSRRFIPHPYQDLITDHQLDRDRGNTWAGMGMGKTGATLTSLGLMTLDDPAPALIIAPLRVARSTWPDEQAKWSHLKDFPIVSIVDNGDDPATPQSRLRQLKRDAAAYTINYDNLPWLIDQFDGTGRRWPFTKVVADESTRLKGFRTKQGTVRAKALGRVAHTRVKRWINLTGTPAPNGLKDLWGPNWFVDAGERLGRSYQAFSDRWFSSIRLEGYVKLEPHYFAQEQIEGLMRDVTVSVDPKDYFPLEDPIVKKVEVELPPKARQLYRDMEKEMFMELGGFEVEAPNAGAKTMKCLQIASGAAYVDDEHNWRHIHDAKIDALESIIEEAAGMPILVAYHWKPDLIRLKKAFPKGRELDANPRTIREWNAGKIPILFAHPQSAGHGLNLQDGGNIVVYFSHWWDLELHDQIMERIGPMRQLQAGHDRNVFVYYIVARGTVDELVLLRHVSKRSVQDILKEAMKRR